MKLRDEFVQLVKIAKASAKASGRRLTNEMIGEKLSVGGTYISGLIGGSKEVTRKHVEDFKPHFRSELLSAGLPPPNDPMNAERALMLAMLDDYAEWKAKKEGVSYKMVKEQIRSKAETYLAGLESWLPEE